MIVKNSYDFERAVNFLSACERVSFDTETTGLMPYRGNDLFAVVMTGVSQAGEMQTWYWNFQHYDADTVWWEKSKIKMLQPIFNLGVRFAHNAIFDMHFLAKWGIEFACDIHCTQIMARVLRNDYQTYSLDSCVERELGKNKDDKVMAYIEEKHLWKWVSIPGKEKRDKEMWFDKVPFHIIQPYAELDAELCFELGLKQEADFEKVRNESSLKSLDSVRENEMKLTKVCFEMEREGFLVDKEYCEKAITHEQARIDKALSEFASLTGKELTDSGDFLAPIFEDIGFPLGMTEKGNFEVQDAFLEATGHPIAKVIQEYRDANKRANTYFRNYLYYADGEGRIHASMKQAGTKTGRFSYQNPNLQNVPKADDDTSLFPVRRAFVPEKNHVLVMIDYNQMEFRMMLDYAKQTDLIRKIQGGHDPHQATADLTKLTRKEAKCIAEGSLVLTDAGLVKIQDVTVKHKVWDGENFVTHGGLIFQGEKEVIFYDGLWATPDHKCYTRDGRKIQIGELSPKIQNDRLMVTGIGETPIRLTEIELKNIHTREAQQDSGNLSKMFKDPLVYLRQFAFKKDKNMSLPKKRKVSSNTRGFESLRSLLGSAYAVLKYKGQKLWGAWYSVLNYQYGMGSVLFAEVHGERNFGVRHRSNRQQRELRARKFASSYESGKLEEPKVKKRLVKVYDIQNAGPNARFTVAGKLVSNCLNFMLLYGGGNSKTAFALKDLKAKERAALIQYDRLEDKRLAKTLLPQDVWEIVDPILKEMKAFKAKYFDALPLVENLISNCTQSAIDRGWVFNWLGRRFYFDAPRFAYRATNSVIQGGCADVVKVAMTKLQPALPAFGVKMGLQVHDEILFNVPKEELRCVGMIRETMESIYPFDKMQLTCSVSHSLESWGAPKEGLSVEEAGDGIQGSFFERDEANSGGVGGENLSALA